MNKWEIPEPVRDQWRNLEDIMDELDHTSHHPLTKITTMAYTGYLVMTIAHKMKQYRKSIEYDRSDAKNAISLHQYPP